MTDPHPLEDLLERTADQVSVGPAPTARLTGEAGRSRRARRATFASAAAVVVIAGGLTAAASIGPDGRGSVQPSAPTNPAADTAPPGTRLVGQGSAAIAVPDDWGTNNTRCGTPQSDTVIIDVTFVDLCLQPWRAGVDSVEVNRGRMVTDPAPDKTVTVDGVRAQRQPTVCSEEDGQVRVCTGTLRLPSLDVWFRAESSTDAATVDRLLDDVRVLDGPVGVPGYMTTFDAAQERSGDRYAALLRREGLVARTVVVDSDLPGGFVVGVSPRPGTIVEPGSELVVKVSAGARR